MPVMSNSTVISHLQQICHVLDEVWDLAEWVNMVEQVVHDKVALLDLIPDLVDPSVSDRENFDYDRNLD